MGIKNTFNQYLLIFIVLLSSCSRGEKKVSTEAEADNQYDKLEIKSILPPGKQWKLV